MTMNRRAEDAQKTRQLETTASVSALLRYVHAARQLGVETDGALAAVGLRLQDLQDARRRVPSRVQEQLLGELVQASGDVLFGLRAGLIVQADAWTVLGYILINCSTLGAAMSRVLNYEKLVGELGDSRVQPMQAEGHVCMSWHARVDDPVIRRHMVENVIASWFAFGQWMAETQDSPVELCFEHALPAGGSVADYERTFGCPVRFGQAYSGIVVTSETLQMPLRQADPDLLGVLEQHAQRQLQAIDDRPARWADRVQQLLLEQWRHGSGNKADIAQRLGVTGRTLQRYLALEGTSYRAVVDELRQAQACRWLEDPRLSLDEIAQRLGFVEIASFFRRFKTWTGMTPGAYRAARLSDLDNEAGPMG